MTDINDRIQQLLAEQNLPSSYWAQTELNWRPGRKTWLPELVRRAISTLLIKKCRSTYCRPGVHGAGVTCPYCGAHQNLFVPLQLFELQLTDGTKHIVPGFSADDAKNRLIHGSTGMALIAARSRFRHQLKVHPANIVACRILAGTAAKDSTTRTQ